MSKLIAQLDNVSYHYPGNPWLFKDLTLDISTGSFHFLTSPSGTGKSSFLKLLYGGLFPHEGNIRLFGQDLGGASGLLLAQLRQRISIVFQEMKLLNHLSVLDNVALPLEIRGISRNEARDSAYDLLAWMGLDHHYAIFPLRLSGGQQQQVAIARAVITKPEFLLADEPTAQLDEHIIPKVFKLFQELNSIGTTVIVATHNIRLLTRYAHPRMTIQNQRIVRVA